MQVKLVKPASSKPLEMAPKDLIKFMKKKQEAKENKRNAAKKSQLNSVIQSLGMQKEDS